jgi:putative acetyltransferase
VREKGGLVIVRPEQSGDESEIRELIEAAFGGAEQSSGTEARIVDALRSAGALEVSLLAIDRGVTVGHAAFSLVRIDGRDTGWFGLGPVAVLPHHQGSGIGAALIEAGLAELRASGAGGCVVLGDPGYYARFGFKPEPDLRYPGPPPEYFQALRFDGAAPSGAVAYHPAFGVD